MAMAMATFSFLSIEILWQAKGRNVVPQEEGKANLLTYWLTYLLLHSL